MVMQNCCAPVLEVDSPGGFVLHPRLLRVGLQEEVSIPLGTTSGSLEHPVVWSVFERIAPSLALFLLPK